MRNREEAARAAEADKLNTPGFCQLVTRTWLDAPSAGDFDGDGAADAEDGWKREPANAKRFDRNPPRGTPVTWLGGSRDNGHRALSLGNGMIRSTDAGGSGRIATVPLSWVERNWGLAYAGWSTTMNGVLIPSPVTPTPPKQEKPPTRVSRARKLLVEAYEKARKRNQKARAKAILVALRALPKR
jgi:hypothetical protein